MVHRLLVLIAFVVVITQLELFSIDLANDFGRIACPKIIVEGFFKGLFIYDESGDAAVFFRSVVAVACYLSWRFWSGSVQSPESKHVGKNDA